MTKIGVENVPRYLPTQQELNDDFGGDLRLNADNVTSILVNNINTLSPRQKAVLNAVSDQSEDGVAVSYGDMERKLFGDDE